MTYENKEKLDEAIETGLDKLKELDYGTEEYKAVLENVSKLIDKQNEIEKIDLELSKHLLSERIEQDKLEKEKELNTYNKKNQIIVHAISIGSILIPVFVTIWGTYKTLKFEETGTVTTIMGRGFINKLIPKK